MVKHVLILDTSVLCCWLRVPGKSTAGPQNNRWDHARIDAEIQQKTRQGGTLVLPLMIVLIMAVVGVWSLARDRAWGGVAEMWARPDQNKALSFLAQLLPPIGIVVAIHVAWVGANEPGGAFPGGALLAAMAMIVMMAGLAEAPAVSRRWLRIVIVAGPATFLLAGVLGFAVAAGFLAYPASFAKALILFIEAFMVLSIAATLPLLVIGPPNRPLADRGTP